MNETKNSAPLWFLICSVLFLIWNLFGLAVFIMTVAVYTTPEALEGAGLNEEQIELALGTPTWVNIAFGIAVIFGVLGCVALVVKKQVAVPLLIISLLGVLAQNCYMYILSDAVKIMGVGASPMVIAGAIALIPFAIMGTKRGWLI